MQFRVLPALAATVLVLVPGCSRNTTEPQPSTPTAVPTTAVPAPTTSVNPNALDDKVELCEAISTRVVELTKAAREFIAVTQSPAWDWQGEVVEKADKFVDTAKRIIPIVRSLIGAKASASVAQPLREYLDANANYASEIEKRKNGIILNKAIDAEQDAARALSSACKWGN